MTKLPASLVTGLYFARKVIMIRLQQQLPLLYGLNFLGGEGAKSFPGRYLARGR